ncbi:hypothetical protein ACFC0D_08200 [Streptomyces sp. NPDC056222]|uniref:hypothetical protein n=1 Tax=Streptomyces sp. NPDC056222 TaxID=3345749 RepID=UPI0035E136F1
MIELYDSDSPGPDTDEETVRPGPFRRHALWVLGITAAAVAAGWATSLFRIGSEQYGLPPAAPGALWPYLAAWAGIGLVVAGVLRTAAAKVPVYAPGRIAAALIYGGTRLSLGWRPEAPFLAGTAAVALIAAAVWCALALRSRQRAPKECTAVER